MRAVPLFRFAREEVDTRLLVLLRRVQRLFVGQAGVDGEIVDDRLALVDGAAMHGRVDVVRPVRIHRPQIAVRQ